MSDDRCQYNLHVLGHKQCGKQAINEIVFKQSGKRANVRCKEHSPNLKNSELFAMRPLGAKP